MHYDLNLAYENSLSFPYFGEQSESDNDELDEAYSKILIDEKIENLFEKLQLTEEEDKSKPLSPQVIRSNTSTSRDDLSSIREEEEKKADCFQIGKAPIESKRRQSSSLSKLKHKNKDDFELVNHSENTKESPLAKRVKRDHFSSSAIAAFSFSDSFDFTPSVLIDITGQKRVTKRKFEDS